MSSSQSRSGTWDTRGLLERWSYSVSSSLVFPNRRAREERDHVGLLGSKGLKFLGSMIGKPVVNSWVDPQERETVSLALMVIVKEADILSEWSMWEHPLFFLKPHGHMWHSWRFLFQSRVFCNFKYFVKFIYVCVCLECVARMSVYVCMGGQLELHWPEAHHFSRLAGQQIFRVSQSLSPVLGLQAAQISLAFHMGAGDSTWVFMAITASQFLGFKECSSGRV